MNTRQNTTQNEDTQQIMSPNQVHRDWASVESEDGVTFSKGNMYVNGRPQVPEETAAWESSNGITNYTTVKWRSSETEEIRCSCNCPGWAMKKNGKPRRCKHTDDMMGIKSCNATRAKRTVITNISTAEAAVPGFSGRELRGIMLE